MDKAELELLEIGTKVVWERTMGNLLCEFLGIKEVEISGIKSLATVKVCGLDGANFIIVEGRYDSIKVATEENTPKRVPTKNKMRGHAFKGVVLKNTTGTKNQELIDQFQGEEFLLDSFSSKYVYGFPVGHFGDLNFRFQLELASVRFYSEGQDAQDSTPYIPLQNYICHVADNW